MNNPYPYYLANDQSTGSLFVLDPVHKQLLKVKSLHHKYASPKQNSQSGRALCLNESSHCQSPRSFAFDQNDIIYFIDANRLKAISPDGLVRTLIGADSPPHTTYRPMACDSTYSIAEMRLYWPSVLRVNPIDNSVYILDEQVIYRITPFETVEVVAGVPYTCHSGSRLTSPVDMAFSAEGDLFILENDGLGVKRVRLLKTTGELSTFHEGSFTDPVAIAVHQNRSVYVLDRGDNVLYHIRGSIEKDEHSSGYTLVSPDTQEAYVFNRFGLHLSTVDLLTDSAKFNFTYSGNALYGKLASVVAGEDRVLASIERDFHGRPEVIQLSSELSVRVKLNNFNMLKSLEVSDGRKYAFEYLGNTGLLTASREPEGKVVAFGYAANGRVREVLEPGGLVTRVEYLVNGSGLVTTIDRAGLYRETWISNATSTVVYKSKF